MAIENIGQILIDNEIVKDIGALRQLINTCTVKQGIHTFTHKDELADTKYGPITVGKGVTIYTWEDRTL